MICSCGYNMYFYSINGRSQWCLHTFLVNQNDPVRKTNWASQSQFPMYLQKSKFLAPGNARHFLLFQEAHINDVLLYFIYYVFRHLLLYEQPWLAKDWGTAYKHRLLSLNWTIHGREIQLFWLYNQLLDHGERKLFAHMTNPYHNSL